MTNDERMTKHEARIPKGWLPSGFVVGYSSYFRHSSFSPLAAARRVASREGEHTMKRLKSGGGWQAIRYTLRMASKVGWWRLWRAMSSRNACKTCALGMGG